MKSEGFTINSQGQEMPIGSREALPDTSKKGGTADA